jgi:Polyketide cyclase / dehydrase and lipid transport
VEVRRSGRTFEAEAVLDLGADAQTIWDTITDYDALARFMPGIHHCHVSERHPRGGGEERLVVEQRGEFRFMMFAQTMKVLLNIENRHLQSSVAKAVRFELDSIFTRRAIDVFEGSYVLSPLPDVGSSPRTHLVYTAVIGLRLPPPPSIGNVAIRQNLAVQLEAVAKEVASRAGRPGAKPRIV